MPIPNTEPRSTPRANITKTDRFDLEVPYPLSRGRLHLVRRVKLGYSL